MSALTCTTHTVVGVDFGHGHEQSTTVTAVCHHCYRCGTTRIFARVEHVTDCSCPAPSPPTDPLDILVDGTALRLLLVRDESNRREPAERYKAAIDWVPYVFTAAQRAAVSAYWSAELRQRVEAGKQEAKQREINVCVEVECED